MCLVDTHSFIEQNKTYCYQLDNLYRLDGKALVKALPDNQLLAIYTLTGCKVITCRLLIYKFTFIFNIKSLSAVTAKNPTNKCFQFLLMQPLLQFKFNNDFLAPIWAKKSEYSVTKKWIEKCLPHKWNKQRK